MTNFQMTKSEAMTKPEAQNRRAMFSSFDHLAFLRTSEFVIRHFHP